MLHFVYVILPILAGLDKIFGPTAIWDKYVSPTVSSTLGTTSHNILLAAGIIEIVAGMIVLFRPRLGAYIIALWLAAIIANLAMSPSPFWDVLARDAGLLFGALSLGSLTAWVDRNRRLREQEGPVPAPTPPSGR